MNKLIQNISIAVVSLLVTLVACEVAARVVLPPQMSMKASVEPRTASSAPERSIDSQDGSIVNVIDWSGKRGIRLHPNTRATIHAHTLSKIDVSIRVNSYGLRGPEVAPKEDGEFRILNVGDSITFGDYMDESETIPALLQEELSASGKRVTVLNAGLPGANASDEFYHYLELADSIKPDLVLVGAYLNDGQDSKRFYMRAAKFPFNLSRFLTWGFQRFQLIDHEQLFSGSTYGEIDEDWREKFRAGRALRSGDQLGSRVGFDFEIYNASRDFGLAWNRDTWERLKVLYKAFAEAVSKREGTKLAMHLFPIKMQVYAKQEILDTSPQEAFKGICSELGVSCFDLLPKLRNAAAGISANDLYYDHCHFKPVGNGLVAKDLRDWLLSSRTIH